MGEISRFLGGGSELGGVPEFGGVLPQASAFGVPDYAKLPQFPTTSEPGFGRRSEEHTSELQSH